MTTDSGRATPSRLPLASSAPPRRQPPSRAAFGVPAAPLALSAAMISAILPGPLRADPVGSPLPPIQVLPARPAQSAQQPVAQQQPTQQQSGPQQPAQPAALPPAFLDDRRLQVIEDHAKPRMEAVEQRRAEKLKRKAVEADVKRKAEEMRRSVDSQTQPSPAPVNAIADMIKPAQANAAPLPPSPGPMPASPTLMRAGAATGLAATGLAAPGAALPIVPPGAAPSGTGVCAAGKVAVTPLPGGRVALDIAEPCHKGEMATIRYTPYVFMRTLDAQGRLRFVLDLFQGAAPAVSVLFKDGDSRPVAIGQTDIDRVSKVAVIWGKPVNLDLHVFEYAAAAGASGHVWSKAPSAAETALAESTRTQRGRGFLSFTSDGTEPGHQVEVYTLWHHPGQTGGVVSTALDFETRGAAPGGAHCGDGALAEVPFETIAIMPGRPAARERGLIPRANCGEPLVEKARFQDEAIADLPLGLN